MYLYFCKNPTFPNGMCGCCALVPLADTFNVTHALPQMMQMTFQSYLQSAWNIASSAALSVCGFTRAMIEFFAAQESN